MLSIYPITDFRSSILDIIDDNTGALVISCDIYADWKSSVCFAFFVKLSMIWNVWMVQTENQLPLKRFSRFQHNSADFNMPRWNLYENKQPPSISDLVTIQPPHYIRLSAVVTLKHPSNPSRLKITDRYAHMLEHASIYLNGTVHTTHACSPACWSSVNAV